jgi:ABC-type nitrate/sulfonate/bicarbonate transport system ATPase subunit
MRVRCRNLRVSLPAHGAERLVLRNLGCEAGQSDFLTFLGPRGCGKTTLLHVIAGLVHPREGEVQRILTAADTNQRVLLVPQHRSVFPWMTALENAAFGLEMQRVEKAERQRRAGELLERYGLAGQERVYPQELPEGLWRRVALIRGFLSDPAVLLIDEPFAALDLPTRLALQQDLLDLWERHGRKTTLFATDDCREAVLLSDRVIVLSPRPAHVVTEVPIPLPRPRLPSVRLEPEFLALERELVRHVG